jgi:hypothetical protein
MSGRFVAALAVTVLHVSGAMAQATAPQAAAGGLEHMFWSGIEALHLTFRAIGTLSGGPDRGAVWQFDVRSHTRTKVGAGTALAWPVQGSDPRVVFALHDGDVVAISVPDGVETKVGPKAAWRKLIGVAPDNTILGLVQDSTGARPALLTRAGELSILPPGTTDEDRNRVSLLLQEDRPYGADRRLVVARSERGGRGFDVYDITGRDRLNASDCGDDACGQPSLSLDQSRVLYIRAVQ